MSDLKSFLFESFNLTAEFVDPVEGYSNSNYRVKSVDGEIYVLKEYDSSPKLTEYLQAETRVLIKLSAKFPQRFQEPVPDIRGEYITGFINKPGKVFRLLKWLQGAFTKESVYTEELYQSLGTFLAELDLELLNVWDKAIESREINWDLQNLTTLESKKDCIINTEIRKLTDYFFLQFRENVIPVMPLLRKSVIHNDANDWNLLTQNGKVAGLIDFGDMVYAPLIQELAVAITYAIFDTPDPLNVASVVVMAYHNSLPLREEETDILYYLIAGRLCMSLLNSGLAKLEDPSNEYICVSERQAIDLLKKWIQINPIRAKATFREATGQKKEKAENIEVSMERRSKFIPRVLSVSYQSPVKMNGAAFQYMYDAFGNTFLDAYNNIPHVGHQHPKVVEAGQRQMAKLNTNTRYVYDLLADYAGNLLSKFPDSLNQVFLINSGSAASDLAIRIAQAVTAHKNIVVLEHGYHGNTRLGIDISHYKFGSTGGKGQADYICKVPIPDTYRGAFRQNDGSAGRAFATQAQEIIQASASPVAAFIAEPIVGCAGQVPLATDYLKNIYPLIRRQGGLCISDEVQTGFGRMGSAFWGYELYGVVPDIVVLGKPMANGHPMGAVVTTKEIADAFDNGMEFFSSFGGNPVSCAIGKAVLEVIEEEGLQQNAFETGKYFLTLLNDLKSKYQVIGDVRGEGLFIGVECVKNPQTMEYYPELASFLKNKMRESYILISTDGPRDNIIKMKPPLCFSNENAERVVRTLDGLLSSFMAKF
ncbi:MAG: aminotransferase class III-fold pyridoxal phosphate-dependent enzyme [Bacteroidales bacterium]|nr:aminotransferase class III-fold pyridoxal phosphate-dependent enzyme [Bacteroidales bacterium]MCF8404226.1 aminotransferase class III-fold pyridoxal phosphate-dependent enzyme [Bacteroidales bacterium]